MFYEVQDILDGKKRALMTKIIANDQLSLKGFIDCSKCTRTLCASASKGLNGSGSKVVEIRFKKTGQNPFEKLLPRQGWLMGLEPTTLGTTNQYSNQLSYSHRFISAKLSISTDIANFLY